VNISNYFYRKSLAVIFFRIFAAFSSLAMTIAISRSLSINDAGLFFLAMTIITVLVNVSTMGFTTTTVRYVAQNAALEKWNVVRGLIRYALSSVIIFSAIVFFIGLLFSSNISDFLQKSDLIKPLRVMLIALPLLVVIHIIAHAFQGIHRQLISVSLLNIFPQLSVLFLVFLSNFFEYNTSALSISFFFLIGVLMSLSLGCFKWFSQEKLNTNIDLSLVKKFSNSAKPIWLVVVMSTLVQWSSLLVLGIYESSEDVALYSVAHRVSLLVSLILVAVNSVASPNFAALSGKNEKNSLRESFNMSNRLIIFLGLPCIFLIILLSDIVMGLFGANYIDGSKLLIILIIGQAFNVLTGSVGVILNMRGFEDDLKKAVLIASLTAIFASMILIPLYGVIGAALATAFAIAMQNLVCSIYVWKRLKISIFGIFN
tara:strand:+ start:188 stop:1471 length:1284 start_codon:yes stop_codon:yes gene_type:complete